MPMRIDDKKIAVEELQDVANKAVSAVAADYHGTSVAELTQLRAEARASAVHLKVIRNTLAKRALSETKFSCFEDLLVGPTMLAFSLEDPTSAAKLSKIRLGAISASLRLNSRGSFFDAGPAIAI